MPCGLVLLLMASRTFLDAGRPGLAILQWRLMFLAWPWLGQSSGCKLPACWNGKKQNYVVTQEAVFFT